ncbi:hypothetical protein [Gordonia sp. ABSL49_1]|uniref:hypothetical protein n=1 Tax=Gordonia sp. ABSL49_1 TaxID=2920941 RepID=UPI001F0CF5B0|nr:hypothetical protein [Gordonia sp. ABSL49_1]MCH5644272.1 hypothetical protein [Gordonia sp. ABSL49_1]
MAKKSRRKKQTSREREARRRHLHSVPPPPAHDDFTDEPLFQQIRASLRTDEPIDLLMTVAALIEATDPRNANPLFPDEAALALDPLVESFIGLPYAETTAALMVMKSLIPDDALRTRIASELATRRHPMPNWLNSLADARASSGVSLATHELGDGDDYVITVDIGRDPVTFLVFVDHNLGSVVKDAFPSPESHAELLARMRETIDATDGAAISTVDPAAARATLEDAIKFGAMIVPRLETDTWPMCRPILEWALRLLPAGGVSSGSRPLSDEEQAELSDAFFASSYGRDLDNADARSALENLMWLNDPDPLRWSPVVVERMLVDLIPGKVVDTRESLARYPDLMRAFIEYCLDQRGATPISRFETTAAVMRYEKQFHRAINNSNRNSRAEEIADIARLSFLGPDAQPRAVAPAEPEVPDTIGPAILLRLLDDRVGGRVALFELDDTPLPDEDFVREGIPDDIVAVVEEVLDKCDACADAFFDVEHRTAMRRMLSRAARNDPTIFRRKVAPERLAAAIGWAIGRANDSLNGQFATTTVTDFLAWFGVKGSVAKRAEPILAANGAPTHQRYGMMMLGAPDLLTSEMRQSLMRSRDMVLQAE